MVAVNRGSTAQITVVKETTPGTTPSTPTMLEMPVTSFTPTSSNTVIRSDQIRAHPFVDKMLYGRLMHEFGLEFELQGSTHDPLIETFFGNVITSKSMAMADALKSVTIEEKVKSGDFNQFSYGCFSSMSITASAGDTTPVKVSMSGMAKTGTLDASATLATAVTAAPNNDPFTFVGATVSIAGNATPVASGTINLDRAIDPLMLLGNRLPREFVPGAVTATGTLTIPYDDTGNGSGLTLSTLLTGFTDAAQIWTFGNDGATVFRRFTFPKTKITSLGRSLSDRGMRMQEVNWEAYYDPTSLTDVTLTTE